MTNELILIDGDNSHAQAIGVYLERREFDVYIAASSDDAMVLFDNLTPHFVLADPIRTDTGTVHLLKKLMKSHADTKVIVYTDPDRIEQVMDDLGPDVVNYLPKPIKSQALEFSLLQAKQAISVSRELARCQNKLSDLSHRQNIFEQLFDESPCYISVQDRKFRLTATNRLFKKDFGDELGSFCYQVYKHRDTPCQECPVASTFSDGEAHSTEEIVTSKSGKQYHVLTWTAPIRDNNGEITQVMEMSTNITQIRQLQDHLTSLGLMLGSMSHGVKGMLTALDGGIYHLETGIAKKDIQRVDRAFNQVKQMSGRIRKMVLEILYYAKSRKLSYKTIDIDHMAQKVVESAKAIADKNGIRLEVDIADDLGAIEVDPNWMQSALLNFLENAIDACTYDRSKSDHHVSIQVFEIKPDRICFIITDNGMGMDQETKEKMFTLFFTSKGSQGTGLGMFIANRVILQHGGNIKVESTPQEGSRFQICLPRHRPEHPRMIDFPKEE